MESTAN